MAGGSGEKASVLPNNPVQAAAPSDKSENGDMEGRAVWLRIVRAVEESVDTRLSRFHGDS